MTRAQSRRLGLECAALCAELAQMVPEGVIHVAIEACYPLDRVREALVHAGRLGGPARSCFFPIWGCWMPRATVFLTQPCSSPLPRRSEPPDRWVLVGLMVSVHS